jgi:hypothetical protein
MQMYMDVTSFLARVRICAFVAAATALTSAVSTASPIVSISGPSAVLIGDVFTLNVDIGTSDASSVDDVSDLFAYQLGVTFDPARFAVNSVAEGSFLASGGATFFLPGLIDNTTGLVSFNGDTLISSVPGVTGQGTLLSLEFVALAGGSSSVTALFDPFNGDALLDSALNAIDGVTTLSLTIDVNTSDPQPAPVPEPSTLCLVGLGATGLYRRLRNTRR